MAAQRDKRKKNTMKCLNVVTQKEFQPVKFQPGHSVRRIKEKRKRPTQPESTTLLGTGSKQGTAKSKQKSNQARERRFLILAAKLGFFLPSFSLPQSAEPLKTTAPC
ncbi:hypothetical protein I7I51_06760 [Histoplasma capsulatum]|uniref:Uncharacterized protein n=1 Tax=Ajellomyces capsulatus TaxID=5037 RepID=A0A8A1MJ23_AJECA|nr:hypothetical protein I7I51_06760 [Histoplasma capsulatum]